LDCIVGHQLSEATVSICVIRKQTEADRVKKIQVRFSTSIAMKRATTASIPMCFEARSALTMLFTGQFTLSKK
jgi:hypothetical protein